jgi:hypothetical protein
MGAGVGIGVDLDTADISCLIYWIMMQTANSATEDLREIMKELNLDHVVEFTASLRDPVDVLGTPNNTGAYTHTGWAGLGR